MFEDPTIRLSANAARDVAVIKIKIEGLTNAELESEQQPKVVDATQPMPAGTVIFSFLKSEDAGPSTRSWYFLATIEGLPVGQTQKRQSAIQFESLNEKADYILSNQALASSNWTVLPPPDPWVMTSWVPGIHCAAMSIIPGDSPATGLQLQQSALIEQNTRKPLDPGYLKLCRDTEGKDCGAFDVPPHSNAPPLYLCVTGSFHGHGNYRGALSLSALEKPETQSITLNIYSSSFAAKLFGFVLIIVGVLLAWVTKVWASNRLTRDQELLPMTMLRRRVEGLQADLASVPVDYKVAISGTWKDIDDLLNKDLTTVNMDARHYIHPASPNPLNTLTIDTQAYKAFLSETDTKVNLLTVLIEEGIKPAIQTASRGVDLQKILDALKRIDTLRGLSPLPSDVQARATITQQILPDLARTIAVAAGAKPLAPELAVPVSFDRLLIEISGINLLVWGITALLTSLVGLAVLILGNPGFGLPLDYIYCIFWGFGIPTAVEQLNASSAMNALGVSVPK